MKPNRKNKLLYKFEHTLVQTGVRSLRGLFYPTDCGSYIVVEMMSAGQPCVPVLCLYVLTRFRGTCTSWTRSEAGLTPSGKLTVRTTTEQGQVFSDT